MRVLCLIILIFGLSFGGAKVEELKLPNGVKLLLKETKGSGIVSGVVFIKSGTHGEKKRGLTHLTSTLLTKGTKSFNSYEIASAFEDFGGGISTASADDYVEVSFATKREGLKRGLEVIKSILLEPVFNQEDMEREKSNLITAIRSKRERGMELAMEHLRELTYKGSSYEVSPLGREEDVKSITREDIEERWKEVLKGGNVVVSIVGDFKVEEVLELVKDTFSLIPSGEVRVPEKDTFITSDELKRVKRPGAQATVLCAFNAPSIKDKEYFAFKVLISALGNGMTSKLFRELREKKGYAYATYAFYPTRLFSPRAFAYIGTSPDKKNMALEDLLRVVRDTELTEEDLNLAKSKEIGDFMLDHQTRLRQAWYLGFYELMGFGWKMDEEYPTRIQEVSLEDIQRLQKEYFKNHHCVVVEP